MMRLKREILFVVFASILIALSVPALAQQTVLSGKELVRCKILHNLSVYHQGSRGYMGLVADIADGWHINSNMPLDKYLIPTTVEVTAQDGIEVEKILYPEPVMEKLGISEGKMSLYKGHVVFGIKFRIAQNLKPQDYNIKVVLKYQGCNNLTCIEPASIDLTDKIHVGTLDETSEALNTEIFSLPIFQEEKQLSTAGHASGQEQFSGIVEKKGLLLTFIIIFIGGLALNLTPCIYPLIPITVSYFGGQAQGKTSKTLTLAFIYVFGMSLTYSLLGTIAAMTGNLFGSALQNPIVIAFIAAVLVALATSMFDMWEIRMPTFIARRTGTAKQGYIGSLIMGLTVGIVAAPCIGPFVLGLLTYVGSTGNPLLGFFMFFTLAWGMGVPFIVLGTLSGSLTKLPKSGDWMVWVKKVFGFILIAMAFYFLRPVLGARLTTVGYALTTLIGGIYLGWLEKSHKYGKVFNAFTKAVGVLSIAAAIFFALQAGMQSRGEKAGGIAWQTYSEEAISSAKASGMPVIIDFSADWCIPCHELEDKSFVDKRIIDLSKKFVTLKVDMTRVKEREKKLKNKFDVKGVPTIIFFDRKGNEIPHLRVTGFVEADEFLRHMQVALSNN